MDSNETVYQMLYCLQRLCATAESRAMNDSVKGTFFVLNFLHERGSVAVPSEISTAMNVSSARVAMLLHSLENHGYVTRTEDKDDRRRVDVAITDAGHEYVQKKRDEIFEGIVRLVDRLGEEDVREYIRITDRIVSFSLNRE